MTTISIHRTRDGVLTSADSASLTITDEDGATVLATTAVVASSAGVYSYETLPLNVGSYTATWAFTVSGFPIDYVSQIFQVETLAAVEQGVTLAEIERAIAQRVGPYWKFRVAAGSSINGAVVAKLRTAMDIGDYEDLFIIRRGIMNDGSLVANFPEDDRQRAVQEYVHASGRLVPDYAWTLAPQENEIIELHYFDADEMREIAVQGLRRCFFWDTLEVAATTFLQEVNLTTSAFWLTRPHQVRHVQQGRNSFLTRNAPWFEPYQMGGNIWLRTTVPNIGTMRVSALRPHNTYVNNQTSAVGPNHDMDILSVDREYAARAGHIAAWMLQTPRMSAVAARGMAVTMKQAADAFTAASMTYVKGGTEIIQNRFGVNDLTDFEQIGNA